MYDAITQQSDNPELQKGELLARHKAYLSLVPTQLLPVPVDKQWSRVFLGIDGGTHSPVALSRQPSENQLHIF